MFKQVETVALMFLCFKTFCYVDKFLKRNAEAFIKCTRKFCSNEFNNFESQNSKKLIANLYIFFQLQAFKTKNANAVSSSNTIF